MRTLHTTSRFLPILTALLLALLLNPSRAAGAPNADPPTDPPPALPTDYHVEYIVSLQQPQTQMVDMKLTLRGVQDDLIEVALPVWRPGRYEILDFAGTIQDVRAWSGRGEPLPMEKFEKSAWMIQTDIAAGDDVVTVEYRVYANALANRTRHVDDTHAFLSPSSVFMYAPAARHLPLRVRVEAPDGWRTATGMRPDPEIENAWIADDYDILVDSPLEIGIHDLLEFDIDGIPHEIAIWIPGPRPNIDTAQLKRDFAAIVEHQKAIFGDLPYDRYIFLIHCYPGGRGGTEHLNSTIMQVSPSAFDRPETYRRFLKLVSHEMFHTWNVKQFRPAGLLPYDYQHENYTHLLWVAEGTTSYYDWLTLVRADLMTPDDYLRTLSDSINSLMTRPGASVQSLEDSSFDAWIKFNKPTPHSINSTVSFYSKGALVSLLLDMEIRARTQNRASLDDAMRNLYRAFPLESDGYTREDVIRTVERLTGTSFRRFFDDYISGTAPLDFAILRTAGIEAVRPSPGRQRAYLGFNVESRDGNAAVTSVLSDGPAFQAGLMSGDHVVAINGQHIRAADLQRHTRDINPGDTVELSIIRHEITRTIEFIADGRPRDRWTLRRAADPTDAQRHVYESWLGRPWPQPNDAE